MSVEERSSRRRARVACSAFIVLLGAGCGKDEVKPPPSVPAAPVVPSVSGPSVPDTLNLSAEQRAIIQEMANDYDVDPAERPPRPHADHDFPGPTTPDDVAPRMRIATLHLKAGHPKPKHRLIARIRSDGDYSGLGIRKGMNVVWRSSWDTATASTWVTKIIPLGSGGRSYELHRDTRRTEYTSGTPAEPRLVRITKASFAIAACLDDPMCGSGHCGYW